MLSTGSCWSQRDVATWRWLVHWAKPVRYFAKLLPLISSNWPISVTLLLVRDAPFRWRGWPISAHSRHIWHSWHRDAEISNILLQTGLFLAFIRLPSAAAAAGGWEQPFLHNNLRESQGLKSTFTCLNAVQELPQPSKITSYVLLQQFSRVTTRGQLGLSCSPVLPRVPCMIPEHSVKLCYSTCRHPDDFNLFCEWQVL